jgi:hypothetical protein
MIWSVAEGRRGRRWRAVTTSDGTIDSDLLIESATSGRPTRLELATNAGLLTLHPEPDEAGLHGNTVTPAGIRHHDLPWSANHVLLVEGSPLSDAVAVGAVANRLDVGGGSWFGAVVVDRALVPRVGQTLIVRFDASIYAITMPSSGEERRIIVDAKGLPAAGTVTTWELERD